MTFERVTTDPEVVEGMPCIRGLRVPVATVVGIVGAERTYVLIAASRCYCPCFSPGSSEAPTQTGTPNERDPGRVQPHRAQGSHP